MAQELERRELMAYAPVAEVQRVIQEFGGGPAQAVTAADGVTTVVWTTRAEDGSDNGDVYGRRLDPQGRPLGDQFRINDVARGAQTFPRIGVDAQGGVVVAWQDSPTGRPEHSRLQFQRYDARGTKLGANRLLLNEPDAARSSDLHVFPDGGFCIVGPEPGRGYLYMRFDAEGRPQAGAHLDDLVAPGWRSTSTEGPIYSDLGDGVVFVVWSEIRTRTLPGGGHVSDGRSWVRRLAPDGRRLGPDVLIASVSDTPLEYQAMLLSPSVTALAGGGFLASWDEWSTDEDSRYIIARRGRVHDAGGNPTGEVIPLSTATGVNRDVRTAQLGDGNLVVLTIDHPPSGRHESWFQIYSRQGEPITGMTRIDARPTYEIHDARILPDQGSGFLTIWSSMSPGRENGDVFALSIGDPDAALRSPAVLLDKGKDGLKVWGDYISTPVSPWVVEDAVSAPDGRFYIDLGSRGLWAWDDSGMIQINAADPEGLLVGPDGSLLIDYGAFGLWRRGVHGGFERLNAADPDDFVAAAEGTLYIDYGAFGLWRRSADGRFDQLNAADPEELAVADDGSLYIDFGPFGIWRRDDRSFARLNAANPESMTPMADGSLLVDFGSFGLWRWDDGMSLVNAANPESVVAAADGSAYIDFGRFGLWNQSAAGLVLLHAGDSRSLVVGRDGYLYVDLGSSGIRRRGPSGVLELVDAFGARRIFA